VGCEDHDWIHLAQDRIQWCVCGQLAGSSEQESAKEGPEHGKLKNLHC
jgi:hypothetical protein